MSAPPGDAPAQPLWRNRNVAAIGFASLLNDVASEMVAPVLPVFVATTLGGGAIAVGAIEGTADLVAAGLKWAVGAWSDRLGRTRPFVVAGYLLAAGSRPFLALAAAPIHVLMVRVVDRVGKGVRTAPRDALLAASVPPEARGTAFGIHRSMDHTGATIGPALCLAVLAWWTQDLRVLFVIAAVPGLAAAVAAAMTRSVEVPRAVAGPSAPGQAPPTLLADRAAHRTALARVLVPIGLATLGTAADAFLMLRAGVDEGNPLVALPLLWIALGVVRLASATPGGWLSDRVAPLGVVATGWAVRAAVFAALALAPTPGWASVGVVAYGFAAVSEGAEKKLVGELARGDARGAAFGAYHAVMGIAVLPASLGFGALWDAYGSAVAFGVSAGLVAAATVLLLALAPRVR